MASFILWLFMFEMESYYCSYEFYLTNNLNFININYIKTNLIFIYLTKLQ